MPTYPCDMCDVEVGLFSVGNMDTGDSKFLGPRCMGLFGTTWLHSLDVDTFDATVKELGYQLTKAERDRRKAAELPDVDPNRTIGEIIESAPRPPGEESTSDLDDESAEQQVDKTPDDGNELMHNVAVEEMNRTMGIEPPEPRVDADDPAPY